MKWLIWLIKLLLASTVVAALCLLFILFCIPTKVHAAEPDKRMHFAGSAVLSFAGTYAFKDTEHPMTYAVAATMAVGLAKELRDRPSTGFSSRDLAADLAGALVGAAIGKHVFVTPRSVVYVRQFN